MTEVTTDVTNKLKLYTNAVGSLHTSAEAETPTTTLPAPDADNAFIIESRYADGNWGSAARFKDTTFVYYDKLLTGNFKIRARVQVTDYIGESNSKGIMIGAFKPDDATGLLSQDTAGDGTGTATASIFFRGSATAEIRSAQPRVSDANSAGSIENVPPLLRTGEYAYEVVRTADGMTVAAFIDQTGTKIAEKTWGWKVSSGGSEYDTFIQADTPVYAGIALMAVKARISEIQIWDGDIEGEPIYASGKAEYAAVPVEGISVGVQGGELNTTGGTADNPSTYIVKASDVKTSGIKLEASTIPSYADNKDVTYHLSTTHTNASTILVDKETGLVSVSGIGTATIQVTSMDGSGADYYLTIKVVENYVPVTSFTITSSYDFIFKDYELPLSITGIEPAGANPVVVWSVSDDTKVKFINDTDEAVSSYTGPTATIKGLAAGENITITATATTTNPNDSSDKATIVKTIENFSVKALSAETPLSWTFDTLPDGWENNKNAPTTSTVDYGNDLLLEAVVRTQKMVFDGQLKVDGTQVFSTGYLQPGGAGIFATLKATGPFMLKFNYTGAGDNDRYPGVSFSTDGLLESDKNPLNPKNPITTITAPKATPSTGTSNPQTYTYNYGGNDTIYIHIASGGNAIRLYDLILTK